MAGIGVADVLGAVCEVCVLSRWVFGEVLIGALASRKDGRMRCD